MRLGQMEIPLFLLTWVARNALVNIWAKPQNQCFMKTSEKAAAPVSYQIHNCHAHIFTIDYIPKYFLSRFFPTNLARKKWIAKLGTLLFKKSINRYAAFFYSGMKDSQMEVLQELRGYYPSSAKFCILSVDFDYMAAGAPKYNFIQQIENLAYVDKTVNEEAQKEIVLPFLCIDPRRENLLDLVKLYIEEKGFKGLKLYPGLGYFPNDKRLYPIYAYAEKYQIPITAHCIPKNKNHFRFKPTAEMIAQAKQIPGCTDKDLRRNYDFAEYLNHPDWYEVLLQDFPLLKVNLAHFGGNEEWDKYLDEPDEDLGANRSAMKKNWYSKIRNLLKKHPNVYADISFTVFDQKLYPLLKNLINSEYDDPKIYSPKDKVLFGTDFYMLQKDYRERRFGIDLRGYLSEAEYWQICDTNPRRFLNNKLPK